MIIGLRWCGVKTRVVPHEEGLMNVFFEGSQYLVKDGQVLSELYAKDAQELDSLREKNGVKSFGSNLASRCHLIYDRMLDPDFSSKIEKLVSQGLITPKIL